MTCDATLRTDILISTQGKSDKTNLKNILQQEKRPDSPGHIWRRKCCAANPVQMIHSRHRRTRVRSDCGSIPEVSEEEAQLSRRHTNSDPRINTDVRDCDPHNTKGFHEYARFPSSCLSH
ncbi:hypothetical protein J6590_040203 [Homalodisca vitripennis]|nr:hypothetical protein J6590_040203 [Homalodisca vitripennis]